MKNVVLSEKDRLILGDILVGGIIAALGKHDKEDVKTLCYRVGHGEIFENLTK